jgi:hypothetical protein
MRLSLRPPGGARTDAKGKGDTWAAQFADALRDT